MAVWRWIVERQAYCIHCQKANKRTNCAACEYKTPMLMEENGDVWQIWQAARTQWRVGMDRLVGLDYPAVFQLAAILDIEITPCLLKKLDALETYTLKCQQEKKMRW